MNIKPVNSSYYFSLGCYNAFTSLELVNLGRNVFFIELNIHNLKTFLSSTLRFDDENIFVIICNSKLLPVAHFYQNYSPSFIVVFNDKDSISKIQDTIITYNRDGYVTHEFRDALSHTEFKTLIYMMNGLDVLDEARRTNKSIKTVYAYRTKIARKLGLKKLEFIYTQLNNSLLCDKFMI